MNSSKRARHSSSIANRTNVFGNMSGSISTVGLTQSTRSNLYRNGIICNNCIEGDTPAEMLKYMRDNNLLFTNHSGGGVGRMYKRRN